MSPSPMRWEFCTACPPDVISGLPQHHPLIVQTLYNRNLIVPTDVEEFLTLPPHYRDPFPMQGLETAVRRIRRAIRAGEMIVVYGDFDADGVTSAALMVQTLSALGGTVRPYIPHRVDEGYGLNCDAMERIAKAGAKLVVTVDCGIRSLREVAYGQSLGMDMIVTDHHSIGRDEQGRDVLPPALAVVNPKRQDDPYPFKDFAGVGLAFKLAQGLMRAERRDPVLPRTPSLNPSDLVDLVALGTVADVMPLIGENRELVRRGLDALRRPRRPGIIAMLAETQLNPARITSHTIGFVLGPRLNAAGRLESSQTAYDLLTAADAFAARPLADRLGALNRERQEKTLALLGLARERIAGAEQKFLHLIPDKEMHYGIMGLVAGRLTEELCRPVLVAKVGETETRGSGRSIPEFHITSALDECRDLLVRHGGHAAAAGFTVRNEDVPELTRRLESIAERELNGKELARVLKIDAELDLSRPDYAFCELLGQLEPYGEANPQPVFATQGAEVVAGSVRTIEARGNHLKLRLKARGSSYEWEAIGFRMGELAGGLPGRVDVAYCIEMNDRSRGAPQLTIQDIRPA